MGIFEGIEMAHIRTKKQHEKAPYNPLIEGHHTFKEMGRIRDSRLYFDPHTGKTKKRNVRGPDIPNPGHNIVSPEPKDHWEILEWALTSVLNSLGGYKYLSYKGVPMGVITLASGDLATVTWFFHRPHKRNWRGFVVRHPFPCWDPKDKRGERFETPWQTTDHPRTNHLMSETIDKMREYQISH